MKDYSELSDCLVRAGAPVGAAECHGFICAQLCLMQEIDEQAWHDSLMLPGGSSAELEDKLRELSRVTRQQLESSDFSLKLLLPPDEARLQLRVEALAEWCRGFLFGLGRSGLTENGLAGNCRELLNDMEHISRVRLELDSTEEEAEFALMEISEYVRMGVLNIYQELRILRQAVDAPQGLH